jgi:hypothetical protein
MIAEILCTYSTRNSLKESFVAVTSGRSRRRQRPPGLVLQP